MMGKITVPIRVINAGDKACVLECEATVDTGAAYLILPTAWKDRLGQLDDYFPVGAELADQSTKPSVLGGPVRLEMEGFRPSYSEVMFMDMLPDANGEYEPLLGHMPLQACLASVDMQHHCLVPVKHVEAK